LYSTSYIENVSPESPLDYESDKERFVKLIDFLSTVANPNLKYFLDYGCGATADTVIIAKAIGFQSFGVEVSEKTRTEAKKVGMCEIFSPEELTSAQLRFDIVFMGDVLEHVSDPIALLKSVQKILNVNGTLIIQGPLEGALTISNFLVAIKAKLLFKRPSVFPPYHVSLATQNSVKKMLRTSGLYASRFEITEPYWPAPRIGTRKSFSSLSKFLLSLAKAVDIGIHKVNKIYGTRFFLIAQNH
jgi:2-polyprenyl-3-methyl-5-hydroxy-6-metoxy-1,4-benzoquinol methylase